IIVKDEAGKDKLGFEYLDGPVTPKPERLPEPRRSKPRRRSGPRKPRSSGPKGDGGGQPPRRRSVPKVPLGKGWPDTVPRGNLRRRFIERRRDILTKRLHYRLSAPGVSASGGVRHFVLRIRRHARRPEHPKADANSRVNPTFALSSCTALWT